MPYTIPARISRKRWDTSSEKGFPGLNVRIAWLKHAIKSGKKEYTDELANYCSLRYDFRTRMNAINAVSELELWNEQIIHELIDAALHWNFRLAPVATDALVKLIENDFVSEMVRQQLNAMGKNENARKLYGVLFGN